MIDMPQVGLFNLNRVTNEQPDLRAQLSTALDAVESCMHDVVNSDVTVLRDASRHIITAGGKRLRPRLMMLSYLAVGGQDMEEAVPLAAAVELVHTASVVHDDINDHGVLRRGRPSVNSIWGRTFALLTGDFLFTKVYELMGPHRDLNIVLAEATVALVEGETLQAAAVKENNFTRQVYMDIIARKTAALFRAAAELGARKALGTEKQVQALRNFGFNVGLAFQIVDDILDIVGDETKLGKTAHIDIEQGRGFVMAQETEQGDDLMDSIKRRMLDGDRLEQARQQAHALVQMAVYELDVLPDNEIKDELIALARMTIDREF
ncbi:MAG: polyprenyl synthetase family protein [Chloroflexota bacterium]|nr:polyprenyl synthetase family protein [Chloroflexota bacterium]